MAMKMTDVLEGKLGNTNYKMVEAKWGGVVVWPSGAPAYEIVHDTIVITFSSESFLLASGQNCVEQVRASVRNKTTGQITQNVRLTLSLPADSKYYIGGNNSVWGHNLGTEESSQYSGTVNLSYQNATDSIIIYQEANQITGSTPGEKQYDYDHGTYTDSDYEVTPPNVYTSTNPCPASGGSVTITARHKRHSLVPWTQTITYTYTSGSTKTTTQSGTQDMGYDYVSDTPTVTGQADGYSISGATITIASRGKETGALRSGLFSASNGNATTSVRYYQAKNEHISTSYVYSLALAFAQSGDLPGTGGSYRINYTSLRNKTEQYSSGSYTETENAKSNVSGNNCTLPSTPSPFYVEGEGYFNIGVSAWSGGTRTVSVTMVAQDDISQSKSVSKTQQPATNIPQGQIYPVVSRYADVTHGYPAGRIQIHWLWSSGTTPTPSYPLTVVFTNLVYHFVFDGETQERTQGYEGQIEATFSANDTNFYPAGKFSPMLEGRSGRCWFTADSVTNIIATYPTDKTWEVPDSSPPV